MQALPESIGNLSALQTLNLQGCSELQVKTNYEYQWHFLPNTKTLSKYLQGSDFFHICIFHRYFEEFVPRVQDTYEQIFKIFLNHRLLFHRCLQVFVSFRATFVIHIECAELKPARTHRYSMIFTDIHRGVCIEKSRHCQDLQGVFIHICNHMYSLSDCVRTYTARRVETGEYSQVFTDIQRCSQGVNLCLYYIYVYRFSQIRMDSYRYECILIDIC